MAVLQATTITGGLTMHGMAAGFVKLNAEGAVVMDSTAYASQSYVTTQINSLINGAPGALDTLNELAAALGNDASFATTITNSLAGKVAKGGDTMTGELVFSMSAPQIRFADTDHYDHWIHVNSNRFYVLSDRNGDGSWETPYPLELNSEANIGYVFGNTIWHSGNLTNLNQLTNGPGYITGESDTLATVTGRGASTSTAVTFNNSVTINGTWQTNISTTGGWSKLSFTASNAWGDGTTYGVLGASGGNEPGLMTYNQHATWVGNDNGAGIRMGRSGGTSSGAWYQVATMASDEFMIAKNGSWGNGGIKITSGGELQHGNSGNKYWHAGNDGSGSGLDADLLDGLHASDFVRSRYSYTQGEHSYGYPSTEGWYKIAEVVLNGNCQSYNLYGNYRDLGAWNNSHYQIHITARAECDFSSNNESHHLHVNIYGSSSDETYFTGKVRVILAQSSSTYRRYELQYYRDTWDVGNWEFFTNGGFTLYSTSQSAGSPTGTSRAVYNSKLIANEMYAAGAIISNAADSGIVNQSNGNASTWYGRILSKNSTNDRSAFLGTYGSVAGVFAHNNALTAWADLYVNTVDGSGGGTVRLPSSVLVNGSQVLHAGNYNSYSPTLTGGGASGTWGINITGTAGSETLATVTGRGASTSTAVSFNNVVSVTSASIGMDWWRDAGGTYMEFYGTSTATRVLRLQGQNGSGSYAQWYIDGGNNQIYGTIGGYTNFLANTNAVFLRYNGSDKFWTGSDGTRTQGWAYFQNTSQGLHWPGNNWHLHPANGSDFIIRSGSNTDSALRFDTNGTTRGYVYSENDNTIGFLTNTRNWALRVYSDANIVTYGHYLTVGQNKAWSSILMHDSDEGTREIHCNSNRIGFLNQSGNWGAWNDDNGNWGMSLNAYMAGNRFDIQGAEGQISFKDGDNVWTGYVGFTGNLGYLSFPGRNVKINSGYNGTITLETGVSGYNDGVVSIPYGRLIVNNNYIYSGSYIEAGSDMRAPIFYDSNNTSYYLDPTSTTSIRTVGSWRSDSSSWDGEFSGKIQYHSNHWYIQGADLLIYRNSGGSNVFTVNQSGTAQATSDFRAPIFYDSNDTTYYLDPNSSSRLRYLYVGDGGSNWSNPGGWDTTLYVSGVNHAIIRVENRQNNYHSAVHSHTGQLPGVGSPGDYDYRITRNWSNRMIFYTNYTYAYGYLEAEGSLRAPIFYDSNNTSYYLDPSATGTSLYVAGSVQGSYYVASNYSSTGYTQYKGYDNNNHFIIIRGRVTGNTTTPTYTGYHRTSLVEYAEANDDTGWFFQTAATGNYDIVARITRSYSQFEGSVRAPIFYDSENTSYYGDFAGTSNLNVLAANSIYTGGGLSTNGGNSLLGVQSPGGASRANGGSTETGAFKITLPSGIPVYGMFKLVVHIYEYGQRGNGYEIHCGGHMYPNYMYNRFQVQYGTANAPLNVRYGNDGTNGCIWIGDTNTTWSYPQIWVSEFMMGYSNTSWTTWRSGWSISLVTSYGNSGAMDGPYTCDYGYAASAGSASTSSQVTINYNNDSNSTYQLLWGSGNSVYGTAGVYVNPYDDRVYANYFSSAYYMDVYTSAGGDYLRITDNQVYRPGGGGLYLNWSSNANVFITGSGGGNVGVGNNSPSYKMHVSGDIYANGGWLRVSGSSGLYFESYGGGWHMTESSYMRAYNGKSVHMNGGSVDYVGSLYLESGGQGVHLQPNSGSYGSLQLTGSRNGWHGIRFTGSNVNLMVNTTEVGFHNNASGWQMRWESGTGYVHKGSTGGGTSATILDSSNYTSWAAPRAYITDSFVEFTIYGDQNTYYPVTIHNWNGSFSWQRYSIHRGYADTAPWNPIGTGVHQAGLTFSFEWAGDIAWGGNDKSIRVLEFDEVYTTTVAGMQLAHCEGVVVWLRGGGAGGAYYRLHGPGGRAQGYTINMSSWTSCAGVTYSPRSYDGGTVNSEIRSRYPVRGSGSGDIFVNNQAVIHSGNIGSQSVSYASSAGNADTVDGYHASNFLGYFGNSYYQANTWIQLNGVHGLYAPSYNSAHWMPNTNSTYTTWRIAGSRNGYSGIHDDHSSVQMVMFDGSGNGGTYREANGRWYWYYHLSNDCMGIGTSSTNSSYSIYSNKGHGVYYSGNNAAGFDAIHSGSINGGSTVQGLTLQWQGYGATYVIAYKQGELSPSDMAHVYSVGGFYFKIFDGSSNRFHRWDDNGSVSINSSSQGSYTFNVTGDIYATADVIAFSDARVKEDVRTVENALDKVTKLRGVTYIKKDEENKKRKMGVIAQEVLEVLPEVVHEDNDGYYGVSYGNIVGVLIEAIKEQQKQIDELKQELKNK